MLVLDHSIKASDNTQPLKKMYASISHTFFLMYDLVIVVAMMMKILS